MSDGNYKINIRTVSDTSGIDKADKALADLKGQAADLNDTIDQKLAEIRGKAGAAGEAAGGDMADGFSKGGSSKSFGLENVIDVNQAQQDAWRVGSMIGSAIARGWEATMGGRSFMAGVFGDYDFNADPAVQKMIAGMDGILEKLNKKPEAGGIIEWLDEVKQKAMEAADEIEHLANLQKIDQGAQNDAADAVMSDEEKAIDSDPNLTPQQKTEDKAALAKQRLAQEAARKEQERLDAETAALDQFDLKKQQLEQARQAEAELTRRAEIAANAAKSAPGEWAKTDEGKERGEIIETDGLLGWGPKLTGATPMPETYARNHVARAGQRAGIGDLSDPEVEAQAAEKARKAREALEAEVENAAREGRQLQETNTAQAARDAAETSRAMRNVDEGVEAARAKDEAQPTPPAPPVDSGKLDEAATAAQGAAQDVGKSAERLATSTADSTSQIATDIRQMTGQLSNAMAAIQGAIADNSRSIAALAQRTDQASQMAAAALAAVSDQRAGKRRFNGR